MAKKQTQADINAQLKEAVELLKQQAQQQQEISSSLEGYLGGLKKLKAIKQTVARNQKIEKKIQEELTEAAAKGDMKAVRAARKKLKILQDQTAELEKQGKVLAENLKEVNKGNLLAAKGAATLVKTFANLPDLADKLRQKIKNLGIVEMDKAMKKSALSMGVFTKQTEGFRANFKEASKYTNQVGIGIEELAKMQSDYSESLGRNVMLGEEGLKAMANMAAATTLGAEGSAQFAADLDNAGYSAERTAQFTEQVMNDSHALGLNATKVMKNLSQNMKMLNKYNFKGGVKGLEKMAKTASKLGVDMNMVSGMADKLFDIEGAVDMSAQLQVMGGAWAQLADPFKLMYMARNDMEGLMEAVGNAAAASAKFNDKTKEFEISALEMHRLRKVAEMTGVSYDELAKSAKNAAKMTKIKTQMRFSMSKEEQEFISNTAKFNAQGKAEIMLNGKPKLVSQLTNADRTALQAQIKEKENLEEMAKNSQTFDDKVTNLINMLKTSALPLVESINEKLIPKLQGLMDKLINEGWLDKIGEFAKTIGSGIASLVGFFVDHPIATMITVGLAKGVGFLLEKANWISNGYALSQGFLAGNGGTSMMSSITQGMSKMIPSWAGSFLSYAAPALVGTIAGSLGGSLFDKVVGEKKETDTWSNNWGKKLGRLLTTTATGAGAGAAVGSIGAGIGAVPGAIIGGIGGLGKGLYDEFLSGDGEKAEKGESYRDASFTSRPGNALLSGGKIHPLHNEDEVKQLVAMKPNGAVDNALNNGSSTMKIEFGNMHISFDELKINAPGAASTAIDLTKDPQFMRAVSRGVQSEIQKAINGGMNKP